MGDRGNVKVVQYDGNGVYLYTHWGGSVLPFIVRDALAKRWRWDDPAYLARIIFCEMVKGQENEETGYGISNQPCDWNHPVIQVNPHDKTIQLVSVPWKEGDKEKVSTKLSFEQWVSLEDGPFQQWLKENEY
jgi:hypothetical protein